MFFEKSLILYWPILPVLKALNDHDALLFAEAEIQLMWSLPSLHCPAPLKALAYHFLQDIALFSANFAFLDDAINLPELAVRTQTLKKTWITLTLNYLDLYYKQFFYYNYTHHSSQLQLLSTLKIIGVFCSLRALLKPLFLLFISLLVLHLNSLTVYTAHLTGINYFLRFFLLHESEKEVGQADDIFQFIILFLVTLFSFTLTSMGFFFFLNDIFTWPFTAILIVSLLILTTPLNLLLDFGISFTVYVKGTGTSSILLKEVLFDIISTFIIFIRFLIQNIRFLFIFLAIFELFEWVYTNNSFFFSTHFIKTGSNLHTINLTTLFTCALNFMTFVVLYLYYFLHLLFLLIVQISIYIGILLWLFFFLYSTRFSIRRESFFRLNS